MLAKQPAHVRGQNRDRLHGFGRLDGGGAPFVVEHRQLAEDVAGAEVRERDRAAVGVLAYGSRMPRAHDIAGASLIALAERNPTRLEAAAVGYPSPPPKLPSAE